MIESSRISHILHRLALLKLLIQHSIAWHNSRPQSRTRISPSLTTLPFGNCLGHGHDRSTRRTGSYCSTSVRLKSETTISSWILLCRMTSSLERNSLTHGQVRALWATNDVSAFPATNSNTVTVSSQRTWPLTEYSAHAASPRQCLL